MDTGDWRTQLQPGARQRIVNKIMETLKRHLPFSGQEGLQELKKIAVRFEEKIYTAATNQSDYLRKISLKMLTMETKSQNAIPTGNASLDSTAQTGHAKGADWQEEFYQKIKVMKETYFPEINEMYQRIAAKLQQLDSHPQQPKSEQLEKLEVFKAMLQVPENNITPSFNKIRRPIPNLQLGQLPHPPVPQLQSQQNQLNPQLQSMNVHGSIPTMQQNNMSSLQHGSLSYLSGVSMSQPNTMMRDERF